MLACETDNQVESGRWLSPDPLGGDISNPQSLNRYAYALNNPTTFTDPTGLFGYCPYGQTNNQCNPPSTNIPTASYPVCVAYGSEGCIQLPCEILPGVEGCGTIYVTSYGTPGGGGGGGSTPPPKPAPPPSGPSWWGTFAKSFATNLPQTTWNSITSSNGCLNQFFWNTLSNLSPVSPGPSGVAEPAANFINAVKFNSALAYATSQPNYLGGTGLLYPFKSSVFTSTLKAGQDVLEAVPVIQLDLALGQALYTEATTAKGVGCQ